SRVLHVQIFADKNSIRAGRDSDANSHACTLEVGKARLQFSQDRHAARLVKRPRVFTFNDVLANRDGRVLAFAAERERQRLQNFWRNHWTECSASLVSATSTNDSDRWICIHFVEESGASGEIHIGLQMERTRDQRAQG